VRSLTNENGTLIAAYDYDPYGRISLAPVPTNTTNGGPVITGAVSTRTHGSAGTFDIPLPLSGSPGIEMRNAGGNYTVTVTFSTSVSAATAVIASGVGSAGTPIISGNTITVPLSGVADRQTLTLELDNVTGSGGVTPKVLVAMSVLVGDINQNSAVTVEDIELAKKYAGYAVDGSTFTYDVTKNGSINVSDINLTKTMQGQGASLFPDAAYTGHYYHARSGLYLAPYRAYDPTIGRWISRDPIAEKGGLNLYGYLRNRPIHSVDPLGLDDQSGWRSSGGGIDSDYNGPIIIINGDTRQVEIVPPNGTSSGNRWTKDWDFALLPGGVWWHIGGGELDIGRDGKPKSWQLNHYRCSLGEEKSANEILLDYFGLRYFPFVFPLWLL
jgi:RHS repeat-associated protein